MCGRFWRDIGWDEYRRVALLGSLPTIVSPTAAPNLEPHYDVRPTTQAAVFRPTEGGVELVDLRWGLVPFWHRKPLKEFKLTTFNAKSETVASAATFREPFKRRRCLVPARGWYEWTGEKGSKTKWGFTHREHPFLMFAGIWDRSDCDGDPVESFTILTRAARPSLTDWHHREPIAIAPDLWTAWLDPAEESAAMLGAVEHDEFEVREAAQVNGIAPVRATFQMHHRSQ